jgi:hypothetical protein
VLRRGQRRARSVLDGALPVTSACVEAEHGEHRGRPFLILRLELGERVGSSARPRGQASPGYRGRGPPAAGPAVLAVALNQSGP